VLKISRIQANKGFTEKLKKNATTALTQKTDKKLTLMMDTVSGILKLKMYRVSYCCKIKIPLHSAAVFLPPSVQKCTGKQLPSFANFKGNG
jgi:hypothetical protein